MIQTWKMSAQREVQEVNKRERKLDANILKSFLGALQDFLK